MFLGAAREGVQPEAAGHGTGNWRGMTMTREGELLSREQDQGEGREWEQEWEWWEQGEG